jgi:coatomer subunit beta'
MRELATLAREHGKNNVAFLSLFLLGELEACIQLLVDRYYKLKTFLFI